MRRRQWKTLQLSSLFVAITLAGCGTTSERSEPTVAAERPSSALAREDDVAYLTQIGLMRGHLWVGYQLYLNDHQAMAATHMKHPKAELYSTLVEAFQARGVPGFADPLAALADRVGSGASTAQVQQAYEDLQAQIRMSEQGAAADSPEVLARVIVGLLRTAAMEYGVGVVDGRIENMHEYQDAYGFTEVAKSIAQSAAFSADEKSIEVAADIKKVLANLASMWPSLAPKAGVAAQASQLHDAAAQVESLALSL